MRSIFKVVFILFISASICSAGVIFSEDYNSITDGWNCSDALPDGWTSKSTCDAPETVNTITHYQGEITSGGRTGNSLKLWRHNSASTDYRGYLSKRLTEAEFATHYKELYVRWYIKIDPDFDVALGVGMKLNRFYTRTAFDGETPSEVSTILVGTNMSDAKILVGNINWFSSDSYHYSDKNITEYGLTDGEWHSIEWRVKLASGLNTNDGILQMWIDGAVISFCDFYGENCTETVTANISGDVDGRYFSTLMPPGFGNLTDGSWDFPTDGWYAIEFDDYVVSTEYIGPIQTRNSGSSGGSISGGNSR